MSRTDPPLDHVRDADDVQDLQDAMEIWREDVDRTVEHFDAAALADRVVDQVTHERRFSIAPTTARRYAAAALLLLGVGIGGTVLARARQAEADPAPRWAAFEEVLVDVIADDPRYAPSLGVENEDK